MDATEAEIARVQEERRNKEAELAALSSVSFDKELYGGGDRFEGDRGLHPRAPKMRKRRTPLSAKSPGTARFLARTY